MDTKSIMPEAFYSLDNFMSYEKLSRKLSSGEFVVGKVISWNRVKQLFNVSLGNDIIATLPISETSIYPTLNPTGVLKPEAYYLIGKIICAKIISICNDEIIISRKANMLEAFDKIKNLENEIVDCYVKSAQNIMLFLDIGFGISGMLHVCNLCDARIDNVLDIGIKEEDFIKAKIASIDSGKFYVSMGYKELFEDVSKVLNYNDLIEVIALLPINSDKKPDGYFAYVNPKTSAILNPPVNSTIPYGSRIVARVRTSRPGKLKLGFVRFI